MQKESLIFIKSRTADPSWLCIFRYVKLRIYKHLLKIQLWGFLHKSDLPNVNSFSLSPFHSLSFSGYSLWRQRLYAFTFLPRLLRPTQEGAQGGVNSTIQVGTPVAYENRASLLSWDFISYLCKPRNISLFLSFNFLMALLPPSITLSI